MKQLITLKESLDVTVDGVAARVPAGTVIGFPGVETRDGLAAALAVRPSLYSQFVGALAHEVTRDREDGPGADLYLVTYGPGGARSECLLGDAEEVAAARAAEAEAAARAAAEAGGPKE